MQSLEEILQIELERPSKEGYALALNASRTSLPTQQAMSRLFLLYDRDGDKWIEVLARFAANNTEKAALLCRGRYEMQRAIISNMGKLSEAREVCLHIIALTASYLKTVALEGKQAVLIWETMGMLLEKADELKLAVREIWSLFNEEFLLFLDRSRNLKDERYLRCLRHMCRYITEAEAIGGLSERQQTLLKDIYTRTVNGIMVEGGSDQSLHVLIESVKCYLLYNWFQANFQPLAEFIGLELRLHTAKMLNILSSDVAEALNTEHDIIVTGDSETRTNLAAKLLVMLSTRLDGALAMLTSMCLSRIESNLELLTQGELVAGTNISGYVEELQLGCLLLCVLARSIGDRGDLKYNDIILSDRISNFFERNHTKLFKLRASQPILNLRILEMVQCFGGCLLYYDLQSALAMLVEAIGSNRSPDVEQGCRTIESLINSSDVGLLQPHIQELSSKLYRISQTNITPDFFEMLESFISHFPILTDMYCVPFVGRLVNRVIISTSDTQGNQQYNCHLALKVLECLVEVMKNKDVVRDLSDDLDQKLVSLCTLFKDSRTGKAVEGKILLLASLMIAATENCTEFALECLQSLEFIYKRSKSVIDLFEVVYECCRYCAPLFLHKHPAVIDLFQRLAFTSIQSEEDVQSEDFRKSCYMLQLILQHFAVYFQQRKDLLLGIATACANIHSLHPYSIPLQGVIISIMHITDINVKIQLSPSIIEYHNKLCLLYYYMLFQRSFSDKVLIEFLEFFKLYSKKEAEMELEIHAEDLESDYFKNWLETLQFPLGNLNPLELIKAALEQLQQSGTLPKLDQKHMGIFKLLKLAHRNQEGQTRKIFKIKG